MLERRLLWIGFRNLRDVFGLRHSLPIIVALYEAGAMATCALIRMLRGHPAAVIGTLRALEAAGIVIRTRGWRAGRLAVECRLTLRGIQMAETPIHRWDCLVRKWTWLDTRPGATVEDPVGEPLVRVTAIDPTAGARVRPQDSISR